MHGWRDAGATGDRPQPAEARIGMKTVSAQHPRE